MWLASWFTRSAVSGTQLVQQLAEARAILTAWNLLAIPVLILLVLSWHEIGHLLAGLSQGMRFLLLIVGPFGWHASTSGIRFQWNTNVAFMGGLAAAVRRHLELGKGGFVEKSRRLLAQAALAQLEGRHEDCERDRLLALKELAKTSDLGQEKLTEDQLARLQRGS